jgi:hypothetical protein
VQQRTGWARDLRVRVAGKGVVSHVGSALLRLLGDRVGLTTALSKALAVRGFDPDLDRGRVLADLAVAVADGATAIDDIRVLRDQSELFGPVASTTTAWRCLNEISGTQLARIDRARAKVRARVWAQIVARHGRIPAARTCYGDLGKTVVIRLDPPPRPDRRPRPRRTPNPALPAAAHRRTHHPRTTPTLAEHPTRLALGQRPARRLHPRPGPTRPDLTNGPTAPTTPEGDPRPARGTGARHDSRHHHTPHHQEQDQHDVSPTRQNTTSRCRKIETYGT